MGTLENPRWEQFCQYIVAGETQKMAYRLAYGQEDDRSAEVDGSSLAKKEPVRTRILELRKSLGLSVKVLSLSDKRAFLREIVTTPVGNVREDSPLCQSYKRRVRTDKNGETTEETDYELPNKLKAIELDAKLAGELSQDNGPKLTLNVFSVAGQQESPVIDV